MMKCTVCKKEATIRLHRHKAKFCNEHFIEYVYRQVERAIKSFKMFRKDENLIVAVSGGKDSMACIEVLNEMGYRVTGVHINLGIHEFSEKSEEIVRKFSRETGIPIKVYYLKELFGKEIIEFKRPYTEKICSICGKLKRYYLNIIASELGGDAIVTGHNLDDACSILLGNLLFAQVQYLSKQYPVVEGEGELPRKVKPLIRLTDDELKQYVELRKIPFVQEKCPLSKGANTIYYKEVLNYLETKIRSVKAEFYFNYLKKLRPYFLNEEETEVKYCRVCGYKTSSRSGICYVCSIKNELEGSDDKRPY